jgi:hypothetical protein
VELHGGHVQAWSEGANRGSSFAVQLPVRAVQHAAPLRRLDFDVEPKPVEVDALADVVRTVADRRPAEPS